MAGFFAVFEDAFISFRYARNLADGHGLVFNIGERVWGYSNFLWTVLLAFCIKAGLPVILSAKCLGVLGAAAIIALLFKWSDPAHLVLTVSGPLLLATSTHFILAAQNGMETVLFTVLTLSGILSLVYSIEQRTIFPLYSILFVLASLTRPEGPLLMATAVGIEAIVFLNSRDYAVLKRVSLAIAIFIIVYGTYILGMYLYYGYPLPNAFYIKVAPFTSRVLSRGLKYVTSFFLDIRFYILLFPILFAVFDRTRKTRNLILITFTLSYLMFVIYVGGDFQVYFYRFLIPLIPILVLLVANGLSALYAVLRTVWPKGASVFISLVFVLILVTNLAAVRSPVIPFFSPTADRNPIILDNLSLLAANPRSFGTMIMFWFSDESLDIHPMGMVGQALAAQIPSTQTLATVQCGQVPFYLRGRRVVDLRGLMDNHIAHSGGLSIDYIATSNIDHFILYYNETPHYYIPQTLIPKIIFSPYFQTNYTLKHVFRHTAFLWPGELKATAYMLLFSKRDNPVVATGGVYDLKGLISERIASGHLTEMVCRINGPDRGRYVVPADSTGRNHGPPPACLPDRENS